MKESLRISGMSIAVAFALVLAVPSAGQETSEEAQGEVELSAIPGVTGLQGEFELSLVPALTWRRVNGLVTQQDNLLPSPDGQYLAQDETELQTYLDLGMQYQYIESPAIRRQLQLAEGQGILILSADETRAGFQNGFREGDLVLMVGEELVDTQYDFVIALAKRRGEACTASLLRDAAPLSLTIQLPEIEQESPGTRWMIGVNVDSASEALRSHLLTEGVVITELTGGSPAQQAGLQIHDVITRINGTAVTNPDQLRETILSSGGNSLKVEYYRAGKLGSLELTPVAAPDHDPSAPEGVTGRWLSAAQYGVQDLPLQPQSIILDYYLHHRNAVEASAAPLLQDESRLSDILIRLDQLTAEVQALREQVSPAR